jgi:hypothetical protein
MIINLEITDFLSRTGNLPSAIAINVATAVELCIELSNAETWNIKPRPMEIYEELLERRVVIAGVTVLLIPRFPRLKQ